MVNRNKKKKCLKERVLEGEGEKKRNCDGRRSVWRIATSFIKHCDFSTSSTTSTTTHCSCYQQRWRHGILCSSGTKANPQKCPQAILCSSAAKVHPQKCPKAPQPYSTRHPRSTFFSFYFYLFFQLGFLQFQQLIPFNSYSVYFFRSFFVSSLFMLQLWDKLKGRPFIQLYLRSMLFPHWIDNMDARGNFFTCIVVEEWIKMVIYR